MADLQLTIEISSSELEFDWTKSTYITGVAVVNQEIPLPAAISGTMDTTVTPTALTVATGHGMETGVSIAAFWVDSGVAKVCYDAVASVHSPDTTITFTGGTVLDSYDLPTSISSTDVMICEATPINDIVLNSNHLKTLVMTTGTNGNGLNVVNLVDNSDSTLLATKVYDIPYVWIPTGVLPFSGVAYGGRVYNAIEISTSLELVGVIDY